jgi:hypothetical protein
MVEAIDTLAPKPSQVIVVLVKQAAIRAVRLQIQRAGIKKYWHMSRAEIHDLAKEYIAALIAKAWEVVKRDRVLWGYYQKEQRQLQRQREKTRAQNSQVMNETHAHNGDTK